MPASRKCSGYGRALAIIRARNLRAAAQKVVSDFGGQLPRNVQELLQLPGVGRYTAGAIASIAFGVRAPVLDGNVERVLCRLDRIETDPRDKATRAELWRRALEMMPTARVGDFNSALMELGATICTPRSPRCLLCPVRRHCAAREAGVVEQVPAPRPTRPTPLLHRHVFCIRRGGRWLIEQRPGRGRWAGLWQFVTLEAAGLDADPDSAALPVEAASPARIGAVTHALTHRRYHFTVYRCDSSASNVPKQGRGNGQTARRWVTLEGLKEFPLPRPHLKVAEMLKTEGVRPSL